PDENVDEGQLDRSEAEILDARIAPAASTLRCLPLLDGPLHSYPLLRASRFHAGGAANKSPHPLCPLGIGPTPGNLKMSGQPRLDWLEQNVYNMTGPLLRIAFSLALWTGRARCRRRLRRGATLVPKASSS